MEEDNCIGELHLLVQGLPWVYPERKCSHSNTWQSQDLRGKWGGGGIKIGIFKLLQSLRQCPLKHHHPYLNMQNS